MVKCQLLWRRRLNTCGTICMASKQKGLLLFEFQYRLWKCANQTHTHTPGSGHCHNNTSTVCMGTRFPPVKPFSLLILYFFMWPFNLDSLSEWWHLNNKSCVQHSAEEVCFTHLPVATIERSFLDSLDIVNINKQYSHSYSYILY